MTILVLLMPLGVLLFGIAAVAFVWAVRHGQFEDLDSEGARILFEDAPVRASRQDSTDPAGDCE